MKKLFAILLTGALTFSLTACGNTAEPDQSDDMGNPPVSNPPASLESAAEGTQTQEEKNVMQIRVEANGNTIVFELNDSLAAADLYEQLPLSIEVENFSNNEKIFYPPQELNTSDAPAAEGGAGTLAYYAPWGDVVMFYGSFGSNGSLFELGEAVSGGEFISELSGTIEIHAVS